VVLLPASLPHILTGLRTAWAFGWRTMVAIELVFGLVERRTIQRWGMRIA
jgi:ABC-type nitrate/sulfonate/bicarbonate transport system permease component